jgi:ABC-2 type transport system ATP-binding protein
MAGDKGRIVVDGLTKTFGAVRAVDGLSFTVEPGSITGFLGPNGAGKTTTLRMLLGLVSPDSGAATISGRAYSDLPAPSSEVGAALEATGFHPAAVAGRIWACTARSTGIRAGARTRRWRWSG